MVPSEASGREGDDLDNWGGGEDDVESEAERLWAARDAERAARIEELEGELERWKTIAEGKEATVEAAYAARDIASERAAVEIGNREALEDQLFDTALRLDKELRSRRPLELEVEMLRKRVECQDDTRQEELSMASRTKDELHAKDAEIQELRHDLARAGEEKRDVVAVLAAVRLEETNAQDEVKTLRSELATAKSNAQTTLEEKARADEEVEGLRIALAAKTRALEEAERELSVLQGEIMEEELRLGRLKGEVGAEAAERARAEHRASLLRQHGLSSTDSISQTLHKLKNRTSRAQRHQQHSLLPVEPQEEDGRGHLDKKGAAADEGVESDANLMGLPADEELPGVTPSSAPSPPSRPTSPTLSSNDVALARAISDYSADDVSLWLGGISLNVELGGIDGKALLAMTDADLRARGLKVMQVKKLRRELAAHPASL